MAVTWKDVRAQLELSQQEETTIELEKGLIRTMVQIREEKGLSQAQLAQLCNVKQSAIARMERGVHSPQIDSLLKILVPLGYTLNIEPLAKK